MAACASSELRGGPGVRAPPAHLIALDRFEEGLEVALAESLVALALDDLEEDRPDHVLSEDLQEELFLGLRIGVDENPVAMEPLEVLAVARDALVDHFVIGVGGVEERDTRRAHLLDGGVDVLGEAGDVLDAFAFVLLQVLVDLALGIGGLVERDAHDPVRRGHRLGDQPGLDPLMSK